MFLTHRPTRDAIERFIASSQRLPLSYSPVGIAAADSGRHPIAEAVGKIGRGKEDFERARAALQAWKQFDLGWVTLFPADASFEVGTVVAVLIRHVGLWSLNGCRVVYDLTEGDRETRFGFAYGTLTNHAEAGEELFEVRLNPQTGDVVYRIRAVSWPRAPLARLGHPIVRRLQARFRKDSVEAMKRATLAM
jgi:uncharacterized protein (UPF0548 family)